MTSVSFTTEKREESTLFKKYNQQVMIIEDKTGINGKYIVIGLLSSLVIVFLGFFDTSIINLVCILLPGFFSLKAIETLENDIEKQWITYWVLFSLFSIVDNLALLIIRYIPFYYVIKFIILVWMFLPNFQGAAFLYDAYIHDIVKKLISIIDNYNPKNNKTSEPLI